MCSLFTHVPLRESRSWMAHSLPTRTRRACFAEMVEVGSDNVNRRVEPLVSRKQLCSLPRPMRTSSVSTSVHRLTLAQGRSQSRSTKRKHAARLADGRRGDSSAVSNGSSTKSGSKSGWEDPVDFCTRALYQRVCNEIRDLPGATLPVTTVRPEGLRSQYPPANARNPAPTAKPAVAIWAGVLACS